MRVAKRDLLLVCQSLWTRVLWSADVPNNVAREGLSGCPLAVLKALDHCQKTLTLEVQDVKFVKDAEVFELAP